VGKVTSELATAGPQALARCKALLDRISEAALTPDLAAETAAVLAEIRAGGEAREGIASFLERRQPAWVNRG
jgi:methylglutaconyl-CoA hydratase